MEGTKQLYRKVQVMSNEKEKHPSVYKRSSQPVFSDESDNYFYISHHLISKRLKEAMQLK